MTAKELMIGDWVQNPLGAPYQVLAIHFYKINGDGDGYYGIHLKNKGAEARLEIYDLHPVPLTPEILEKNGFKKGIGFGYSETYPTYCSGYHNDVRDFASIEVTFYDEPIGGVKVLVRMETNSSHQDGINTIHSCDIESVHELQHALRLCGIEKEIVL